MEFDQFCWQDTTQMEDLLLKTLPDDPIDSARFVRQVLLDPNFRAAGARVARLDGRLVGFCLAIARQAPLENAPSDHDRGYVPLIAVHPRYWRQGIGSRLLQDAEAYLLKAGRSLAMVSPYAPGYFIPGVEARTGAEVFFLARGYSPAYQAVSMETSLWKLDPPGWVVQQQARLQQSGVRLRQYSPEATLPLLEFVSREFPGDWVRVVRETLARISLGDSPSRIHVAECGEQLLGFVHFDRERFGPIGIAAADRGRGLGQALMFQGLRSMQMQGFRTAWFLWSDDRTARRLYDSAGFREVRRFTILRKALSPNGAASQDPGLKLDRES